MSLVSGIPAVEERGGSSDEVDPLEQVDNQFGIGGQRRVYRLGKYGIGAPPPDPGPVGGAPATTPAGVTPSGAMPIRPSEVTSGGSRPQPVSATPSPAALNSANRFGIGGSGDAAPVAPSIPANQDSSVIREVLDTSKTMPPEAGSKLPWYVKQAEEANRPVDPNQPQYKMGIGGKILGTIGNFATGFGGGRGPITYVGPGATNGRFDRDVATQQARAKAANTDLENEKKLEDENEKLYRDEVRKSYESQLGGYRSELGQAAEQNANTRKQLADVSKENADLKSGARDITYDAGSKTFKQNGKTYVPKSIEEGASLEAANNVEGRYTKLWSQERKNQAATPRQPTELETWSDAFKRDNGRPPTADEIAQRHRSKPAPTFRDAAAIDKYSDKWYSDNVSKLHSREAQIEKEFGKDDELDADGKTKKQAALDDAYHGYLNKTQEFEQRKKGYYTAVAGGKQIALDENGEPTGIINGSASTPRNSSAPVQPYYPKMQTPTSRQEKQVRQSGQQPGIVTPKSRQRVNIGDKVTVGKDTMYVTGVNPKTGKPTVSPLPPR